MHLIQKARGLKTLLIDDDEVIRDVLMRAFSFYECQIKVVETAEEGMCALENERFDIIISDFRLPGINGVDFFKQVIETYPDTIRVLISGYGNEEAIREAFELGVHEFMKKPFSLVALFERLRPHVNNYLDGALNTIHPQKKNGI
jgi:DNA-binding NtrC family response regulator